MSYRGGGGYLNSFILNLCRFLKIQLIQNVLMVITNIVLEEWSDTLISPSIAKI